MIYWKYSKIIYHLHFIGVMDDVNGHISGSRSREQLEKSRYYTLSSSEGLLCVSKELTHNMCVWNMMWNKDILPDVNNIPRKLELGC